MVVKANKCLFGDDWFKNFCAFRIHPKIFLNKRKLTRDAFCLDVLKDLYLDHVEIQYKIHLLLLLQEHSNLLIIDFNLLEQVIGSLMNLCNILGTKSDKRLLKNQALVTIVTILLSQNLDTSKLTVKVKSLLLEIIYSNSEDSTVLSTACKCLEELEEFSPGTLESEMTKISLTCEKEMSPAFQSYALLLSVCLKHFSEKLHSKKSSLGNKEEISRKKSNGAVSPFAALLFELLPYMSHAATYRVLRDLIYVVQRTPELSPTSFKLYLQNLMLSSDVSLFHLAFDLLDAFHSDLFSSQDEKFLYKQLIKLSTHPCLTSSHRLLFLDWLKTCIMNNLATDFLNETVSGLIKCSFLSGGTKAAPSLFRILFVYFSSQNSELMHNSMYRLLSGIMKTSPHLMPYALSFLQAVKSECLESKFHERLLGHLVEHILSIPMKQFCSNLQCYLAVLENASQECASISRPRAVLKLLQKLLNNTELNLRNAWLIGNDMLSICRSFMKHHDVQIFYYDLAEVLCLVAQNIDDADVKDRAKIYYSMLTSLSNIKIQAIFQLHSSEKDVTSALSSFVTENDAHQFVSSIQKLTQPILQLIRYEQDTEISLNEDNTSVFTFPDILKTYEDYLQNHEPVVKLPFILKHVDNVEETFQDLYSIVITTQSSPPTKEIPVIELPVLKKAILPGNKETVVFLSIVPVEPYPLTLHFEAEFTCKNGCSYTCDLPSIDITFEDLFMPLLVPESVQTSASSWRSKLFDVLWEHFKQQMNSSEKNKNYCHSSFCLNIDKDNFPSVIEQKWKSFIVSKSTDLIYSIAIYLPPKYHLLLKISVVNDKVFAHIMVDKCAILPWVTLCLQNI
ncbi:AP-5 complex subunit beta-1 like protein [Argiope bruennichi]|uniref:AP-5 complex subunit beta-1 n=1 Tax=Argiope bruennichi TaxID=94029 RepID=A0A8T0FU66_ARGBR|nr:AP-5 complex subunit beta-1 like protein [Argiope bruennichi]